MFEFSCGVFDSADLENDNVTLQDFELAEFYKRTTDWGPPISRYVSKYPASSHIDDSNPGLIVQEKVNSVSSVFENDEKSQRLRERTRKFLIEYEGLGHMLCVHMNQENACNYYTKTLLETVARHRLGTRRIYDHQSALIICSTHFNAKTTCTDLHKGKLGGPPIGVMLLGHEKEAEAKPDEKPRRRFTSSDITVGSASDILEFIATIVSSGNKMAFRNSIKYIVVENSELFSENSQYMLDVSKILSQFMNVSINVVFFAYAPLAKSLVSTHVACNNMVKGNIFVEVEKLGFKELFEYIKVDCISSKTELLDTVSALHLSNTGEWNSELFSATGKFMDPLLQKLRLCSSRINLLKEKRTEQNDRRNQSRNEKILVYTSSSKTANLVATFLALHHSESDIVVLTEFDSVDRAEQVNFSLRDTTHNIVVTDSKSLRDINRGIIDSVIFFDVPDKKFFQTIMEVEMERLISRDAVKLKVYVFMAEKEDLWAFPKLQRIMKKYRQKVSRKFVDLSSKYRRYVDDLKQYKNLQKQSSEEKN